jgi:cytochrome c oxidase subunit 2
MTLIIIITLVLVCIAAHQLLRVVELSRNLKSEPEWKANHNDNRTMGFLWLLFMFVFFAFAVWQLTKYADKLLPESASLHGEKVDWLMNFNMIIVLAVFFIVNGILFVFAFRYYGKKGNSAYFFPHNNKLEMLWTVVPAVALAFIIFFGLYYWNQIMDETENPNAIKVELYAKQFDWTARYPGNDKIFGKTDYTMCDHPGTNMVGLDTTDKNAFDDLMTKEIHLVKGREVVFQFRSRDVIHSAYMPHFRAQMNCVPGAVTAFRFTPKYTTEEMKNLDYVKKQVAEINTIRKAANKDPYEFDFILLCNKICGASHFNMQMKIIVEDQKSYDAWIAKQKPFIASAGN